MTQGDHVRVVVRNRLDEATTIHWHGLEIPNQMDGVPGVSQPPILPGEESAYEFTVEQAGTFMYHSHDEASQATRGLGGAFISEPRGGDPMGSERDETLVLQEWGVDTQTGEPLGNLPAGR